MATSFHRRDLLRAAATAAAAAVVLPATASAEQVWALLGARTARVARVHTSGAQTALVTAIADTILPRTDTPSASDVRVEDFVDVIVSEYYGADERIAFSDGLMAIDEIARTTSGAPFAALTLAQREPVMRALETPVDRTTPAARTYSRLKGLVVHGYFTSERVQREVLQVAIMPGRFDGAAPHTTGRGGHDV